MIHGHVRTYVHTCSAQARAPRRMCILTCHGYDGQCTPRRLFPQHRVVSPNPNPLQNEHVVLAAFAFRTPSPQGPALVRGPDPWPIQPTSSIHYTYVVRLVHTLSLSTPSWPPKKPRHRSTVSCLLPKKSGRKKKNCLSVRESTSFHGFMPCCLSGRPIRNVESHNSRPHTALTKMPLRNAMCWRSMCPNPGRPHARLSS